MNLGVGHKSCTHHCERIKWPENTIHRARRFWHQGRRALKEIKLETQRRNPAKRFFNGVAGSALARATSNQVPAQRQVLLHFCFNQRAGEIRLKSCPCNQRVSLDEAVSLVKQGRADWLLNTKSVKTTKSIVIRSATIGGEVLFAVKPPLRSDRRNSKNEQIKDGIRTDARKIIERLVSKDVVPMGMAAISDAQLDELFQSGPSEEFIAMLGEQGQNQLRLQMISVVKDWWSNVLGYERLDVNVGQFMVEADRGKGELVTGSFGITELDRIEGAHETDTGRVPTPNFRPSYWNGGWDYSAGHDPHRYERGHGKIERDTDSA